MRKKLVSIAVVLAVVVSFVVPSTVAAGEDLNALIEAFGNVLGPAWDVIDNYTDEITELMGTLGGLVMAAMGYTSTWQMVGDLVALLVSLMVNDTGDIVDLILQALGLGGAILSELSTALDGA